LLWSLLVFHPDAPTVRIGSHVCQPPRARSPQRMAPDQAEDAQFVAHTQHCPLPILHEPADDVTSQGADTLGSKEPALQSQVSPHTAIVRFCVTWMGASGCGCLSSPTRAT